MTEYEHLEQRAFDQGIVIISRPFSEDKTFDGLFICIDHRPLIIINTARTPAEQTLALREELAHFEFTTGDILDQSTIENRKAENTARSLYYSDLLPVISNCLEAGCSEPWELSEQTNIPEPALIEILRFFDSKGLTCCCCPAVGAIA